MTKMLGKDSRLLGVVKNKSATLFKSPVVTTKWSRWLSWCSIYTWPSQVIHSGKITCSSNDEVLVFTLLTDTKRSFAISFHFTHT